MESTTLFLARECFLLSSDRLYRVYSSGAELAFVKVAGQGGVGRAVAVQFGLIGALVNAWLEKKAKAKFSEKIAALDGRQVSELLASDKANFSVRAGEVASSTIEPAARLGAHGPHVGKWLLKTADGTSHDFQFEDVTEMGKAIAALEGLLGAMQRVNVRWDEKNGRYAKLA